MSSGIGYLCTCNKNKTGIWEISSFTQIFLSYESIIR